MHAHPDRCSARRLGSRRSSAALALSLVVLLVAMPPASALAQARVTPNQTTSVSSSMVEIPAAGLQPILGSLPVGDLGLSNAELASLITGLEGGALGALGGTVTTLVNNLLGGNPSATLEELTQGLLGNGLVATALNLAGVTITAEGIFEALSPGEVTTLLSNLTGDLNGEQLTQLVSGLAGTLTPEALSSLQTTLTALVGGLSPVQLEGLLADLHALPGGLGEGELALLGTTQLAQLIDEAFTTASPSQLAPVVEDLIGALTWSAGTTTSLAEGLGVPLETLAAGLGESAEGSFGEVPTLSGTLGGEEGVAGVFPKTTGLAFGLLKPLAEELGGGEEPGGEEGGGGGTGGGEGEGGGSGGEGGSGGGEGSGAGGEGSSGTGGSGGAGGSSGAPGGVTVVLNVPSTSNPRAIAPAASGRATLAKKPGRLRILSHGVRGNVATLVLQVPAAGTVALKGWGTHAKPAHPRQAGRVTIKARLTRVGKSSLRGGRTQLKVRLKATFKPAHGGSSTAGVTVTFG